MTVLLAVSLAALLAAGLWLRPAVRAYRNERALFHNLKRKVPRPADFAAARDVRFGPESAPLAGWYLPGTNRAAVVLVHGSGFGADRTNCLKEARLLHARGFSALLYDLPGHAESGGQTRWGAPERESLVAAVTFLTQQPEVDAARIGAFGFSMGTSVVAQVAATDARIAASVFAGPVTDDAEMTRYEYRASEQAIQAAFRAQADEGYEEGPRPIDVVSAISPRPVLFIAGTADETVPPRMAEQLYAAAREPKTLWLIPDAHHGDYAEVAGAAYGQRLGDFFASALLGAR
jgi:dipeptidyl aminopeptidase/acylaminoacyl peptidase